MLLRKLMLLLFRRREEAAAAAAPPPDAEQTIGCVAATSAVVWDVEARDVAATRVCATDRLMEFDVAQIDRVRFACAASDQRRWSVVATDTGC
jgi:hypothetical protein